MAKKLSSVDRRAFLAGIATAGAGAAASGIAAPPAAEAAPVAAPPQKLGPPSTLLAAAETGNPASSIDRWHVHNAGSDYMVDCLKHVGFDYITCMPGSTFRGLHESIINYGGNTQARIALVHARRDLVGHGLRLRADGRVSRWRSSCTTPSACSTPRWASTTPTPPACRC